MPNWCENRLDISGNREQLDTLLSKLLRKPTENDSELDYDYLEWVLDFNLLIPMPVSLNIESSSMGATAFELLQLPANSPINTDSLLKISNGIARWVCTMKDLQTNGDIIHYLEVHPDVQQKLGINLVLGKQYQHNLEQFGCTTWYNWHYQHWGTKWNASTRHISNLNRSLAMESGHFIFSIDFDTAWGPPTTWIEQLIDTFPALEITLSYFEPGCFFAGRICSNSSSDITCHYDDSVNDRSEILCIAESLGYIAEDFEFDDENDE